LPYKLRAAAGYSRFPRNTVINEALTYCKIDLTSTKYEVKESVFRFNLKQFEQ